ncbi:KTSC domain-containing protein [Undibacterium umbellatum]|uniref:KTSC domain-containing protein n=1 Tax=Undibacterium umbellatum TaxID=2762300 RepID=A0ABR6Z507_9BURK|nr:KTSC domain-containing protein [Undibacterium umbellatum]MBC3906242.1 KTSC domain-containing protein [Undibacterium umbellatum]
MSTATDETIELPEIKLTEVKSSQLAAIGHCPATNRLAIQFKSYGDKPGSVYHYQDFDAAAFEAFSTAESLGSYFKKMIKTCPDRFPYTKIS